MRRSAQLVWPSLKVLIWRIFARALGIEFLKTGILLWILRGLKRGLNFVLVSFVMITDLRSIFHFNALALRSSC